MLNAEHFVISFARTVELFRTLPDAVPEQKAALRALLALSKLDAVTLRLEHGQLVATGVAISTSLPSVPGLLVQLREHGVTAIEIARDPKPAELLSLIRFLAARQGTATFQADAASVRVVAESVSAAKPDLPEQTEAATDTAAPAHALEPSPPGERRPPEPLAHITNEREFASALDDLRSVPYEGQVLNRVSPLAEYVRKQLERDKLELAVQATAAFVTLEEGAPDEEGRRPYGITLGRLLQGKTLEALAEMLRDSRFAEDAARGLRRAGVGAVDVLVKRLEGASDLEEAQAFSRVLLPVIDDVRPLLPLLSSPRWCVAQTVADMMGELSSNDAVPALTGAMGHADSRVRYAAVLALAKISSRQATEHLLRAVASDDDALRSGVIDGVAGRRSSALAMPILKVAEGEDVKAEIRRDCYLALGRIGTPEAVRALIKAAEPGGRVLARKSTAQRIAAVEGLGQTADQKALETLQQLAEDRDKAVRQAAADGVAAVRRRVTAGEPT